MEGEERGGVADEEQNVDDSRGGGFPGRRLDGGVLLQPASRRQRGRGDRHRLERAGAGAGPCGRAGGTASVVQREAGGVQNLGGVFGDAGPVFLPVGLRSPGGRGELGQRKLQPSEPLLCPGDDSRRGGGGDPGGAGGALRDGGQGGAGGWLPASLREHLLQPETAGSLRRSGRGERGGRQTPVRLPGQFPVGGPGDGDQGFLRRHPGGELLRAGLPGVL